MGFLIFVLAMVCFIRAYRWNSHLVKKYAAKMEHGEIQEMAQRMIYLKYTAFGALVTLVIQFVYALYTGVPVE